ncbi:MAG: hypothetical protein HQL96_07760 [Magnetococcales bacterium]|nr:hypothetical protein [Magnetococcales bacterium]
MQHAALPLNDAEEDAFLELFNLSFGKAAATLSEMVDAEVSLSLPCFALLPQADVTQLLRDLYGTSIRMVYLPHRFVFDGGEEVPGTAVLLIRAAEVTHFLEALYGTPIPEEMAMQVEEEAFRSAADILLYTCVSSLSAFFSSEIASENPIYFKGSPENLSSHPLVGDGQEDLLLLRIDFKLLGKGVAGSLLTWLDGGHLPSLRVEIARYITRCLG